MRMYDTGEGVSVPSVTTILSCLGDKSLMNWANWLGFKHVSYEKEMNMKADRGTLIHSIVQRIVDPDNCDEVIPQGVIGREFQSTIESNFNTLMRDYIYNTTFTEQTFVSSSLGFGGTMDWVANINGIPMLLDFKSSKQVYFKHLLQLGAYTLLLDEAGIETKGGGIIIINDTDAYLHPVSRDHLLHLGDAFSKLTEYFTMTIGQELYRDDIFK